MVEASLIVSAVSAIIAFVGFVVSAWTFDRSSPSKVHKREQDKTMRKLATQAVLMNHNLSIVVSAAQAAELMNVQYKMGTLDQNSVSRLGHNGYIEADTWCDSHHRKYCYIDLYGAVIDLLSWAFVCCAISAPRKRQHYMHVSVWSSVDHTTS